MSLRKIVWSITLVLVLFVVFLILWGVLTSPPEEEKIEQVKQIEKIKPSETPEISFKKAVRKIFSTPKKEKDSGVTQIIYSKDQCVIHYNYFPLGFFKYEEELGNDLSSKIKKLYETESIDKIYFLINGPFQDKYGNLSWKPIVAFDFDRELFNKINWKNFLNSDLLKVAKNVNWFRPVK